MLPCEKSIRMSETEALFSKQQPRLLLKKKKKLIFLSLKTKQKAILDRRYMATKCNNSTSKKRL